MIRAISETEVILELPTEVDEVHKVTEDLHLIPLRAKIFKVLSEQQPDRLRLSRKEGGFQVFPSGAWYLLSDLKKENEITFHSGK